MLVTFLSQEGKGKGATYKIQFDRHAEREGDSFARLTERRGTHGMAWHSITTHTTRSSFANALSNQHQLNNITGRGWRVGASL